MKPVNCIMLVDDNKVDNFFHERVITKAKAASIIISRISGREGLDYLAVEVPAGAVRPDILFLDINMPGMNGWEFLEEYKKLDISMQAKMVVVMLSTSRNPDDIAKAQTYGALTDFKSKPLTEQMLEDVLEKFHNSDTKSLF